jgi:transposase
MPKSRHHDQAERTPSIQELRAKELEQRIEYEDDIYKLQRLVFVKRLYEGDSVQRAAERVHLSESAGYDIVERWDGDCSRKVMVDSKDTSPRSRRPSDHQQHCITQILKKDDHL